MSAVKTQAETCSVCGRGILKGERTYDYATPAGDVRDVCALCRPSAERAGWLPPSRMATAAQVDRERRRHGLVSALLARRVAGAGAGAERPQAPAPASERPVTPSAPAPSPRPKPPADPVAVALAAFNAEGYPRMIAGLCKTLGPASAEVRRAGDAVEITVAWELSWYQWRVVGGEVREVAKGAEVAEREGPEPAWNAEVGDDGRLTVVPGA